MTTTTPLYADMHTSKEMGKGAPGGAAMTGDHKGDMTQMSGMMHDMADTMMSLSGDMGKGDMNTARQKQMGDRMRDMSTMMEGMSGAGKGGMKSMPGMTGDMGAHQQMMEKRMEMMQTMMKMMMDRMPAAPAK